jgi:protein SCO1/2
MSDHRIAPWGHLAMAPLTLGHRVIERLRHGQIEKGVRLPIVMAALTAVVTASACGTSAKGVDRLPFYDDADFSPRWTESSAHHVADFALFTQTGASLTRADLDGRIHIANFMFTLCPTLCPPVMHNLKKVQDAVGGPNVVLVSFSVTPDVDTPVALAAFGKARGVDPEKWRLVTGDRRTIYRLARESYFADDPRVETPADAILHSEKVLLVDQQGRLRGVYNGTGASEMDKLIDDVHLLQRSSAK